MCSGCILLIILDEAVKSFVCTRLLLLFLLTSALLAGEERAP